MTNQSAIYSTITMELKIQNRGIDKSIWLSILSFLNNSGWGKMLYYKQGKKIKILNSLNDEVVVNAIEANIPFSLKPESESINGINFLFPEGFVLIGFVDTDTNFSETSKENLLEVFQKCCFYLPVVYGCCNHTKQRGLLHNIYKKNYRTFFASGLFWLNFFGPEEEKKQGGRQLEQNPYATRIERFENGLFIQVGETPESCLTPEGEQRLLDATKAMPPVPPPDTSGHDVVISDPTDDKY